MSKTVETVVEIDCPPDQVWSVLTDFEKHPDWNPFFSRISGDLTEGSRLHVRVTPPGGRAMTFKPVVTAASAGRELAWRGSLPVPGMLEGKHTFVLQDLGNRRTRMKHCETFRGALVPLLLGKQLDRVKAGFEQMNQALQDRCERGSGHPAAGGAAETGV